MEPTRLQIRQATETDVPLILQFIRDLAAFENHLELCEATEQRLAEHLFGDRVTAEVLFAEDDKLVVGFAVYYYTFSTFAGLPGIYLEDLFIRPEKRGSGVGRALLRHLAQLAREKGCCRIEWSVLHWNERAMVFYENLGARKVDDWCSYRLSGRSLEKLASEPRS